jgi:hypothetical protein
VVEADPAGTDALDRLEASEHAQDAVEAPAAVDGVGVGAGHEGSAAAGAPEDPDQVPGRVGVHLEARCAHLCGEPLAARPVLLGEDATRPAGGIGCREGREALDAVAEAVRVRGFNGCRHGLGAGLGLMVRPTLQFVHGSVTVRRSK